jgi:hypothetical protein
LAEKKPDDYRPPALTTPPVNDIYRYSPSVELGRTGLRRFSLFVLDDFLQELQSSTKAVQIFREMADNDSTIGAMLFAVKMFCRSVDWYTVPASQSAEDLEAQKFLDECMNDMELPWIDVINEALTFLTYGWALSEVTYKQRLGLEQKDPSKHSKYNDGRVGWRKISLRSQTSLFGWIFAEDGTGDIVAMRQLSPPDFKLIDIPLSKCLLFRTETTKNNPEGRSILRNAVRAWKFRQNIEIIEGIGVERDLAGLPIVKIPSKLITGQDADSIAAYNLYKSLATNIKRDAEEGIVIPSDCYEGTSNPQYELRLLSTGGSRQFDTNQIITRYNTQILATILADFILLGHENIGSYALAATKTNTFMVALQAFLNVIAEVFNRFAIPQLFALNPDIKIKDFPRVEHEDTAGADLNVLGNYLKSLKLAGVPIAITDEMLKHLYSVAGLPDPTQGAEEIKQEQLMQELLLRGSVMPDEIDMDSADLADAGFSSNFPRASAIDPGTVKKEQIWPDNEDLKTSKKDDKRVKRDLLGLSDIATQVLREYGVFSEEQNP